MDDSTHNRFGAYEILTTPAKSNAVIIALAGAGDGTSERIDFDFGGAIRAGCPNVHSMLIKDNLRSWYNAEDGWTDLVEFILAYLTANSITCSTVIGVSMGAYGAFVLAKFISPTRVFGFSTQAEINRGNHYYRRRPELISKISKIKYGNIEELLVENCDYHVVYSIDEPQDCLHAERILSLDVNVHAVRGDHNIASTLKNSGVLEQMLSEIVAGFFVPERYGFFVPPDTSFTAARAYLTGEKDTVAAFLSETPIAEVPDYLLDLLVERRLIAALASGSVSLQPAAPIRSHLRIGPKQLSRFLAYGWSWPEKEGTWSERNLHIIRMFVAENFSPDVAIRVQLDYSLFNNRIDHVSQRLIFYVNGKMQRDYICTSDASSTELLLTDEYVEIAIYTPDAASPAQIHGEKDMRELALRLSAIRIVTYPNITKDES